MECISDNKCREVWGSNVINITPRHQCADKNGVSPCSGDSGGPLTKVNNKGITVLVGNLGQAHTRKGSKDYSDQNLIMFASNNTKPNFLRFISGAKLLDHKSLNKDVI